MDTANIKFSDFTDCSSINTEFEFNGISGRADLDSGYGHEIVIDSTFFFQKLFETAKFIYSPPPFKMYYWTAYYSGNLTIRYGKYSLNVTKFKVYNLKDGYGCTNIDAIVGDSIFENKITLIDYDNNKIAFVDTVIVDSSYIALPMYNRDHKGCNHKNIRIDGFRTNDNRTKSGLFLIDFGTTHGGIIMKRDFAHNLLLDIKHADILRSIHSYGEQDYRWRIDSLQMGTFLLNNVPARRVKNDKGYDRIDMIDGADGLIGLALLKRFNMILDYKHNILYLKPNKYFEEKNQVQKK
ncbi:MAG: retropepsin-like domain-containing protein [Dysgonamonadaceae bacterium]|nr:retropepsin-like domain-containing protein [Dysgonamonadaceae bacterium]